MKLIRKNKKYISYFLIKKKYILQSEKLESQCITFYQINGVCRTLNCCLTFWLTLANKYLNKL